MNKTCSIIIRAFNEEVHIGRLLEGIQKQNQKNIEIILVDSGSTDKTVEIAKRYPVKIVTIEEENFTFGRSLNYGIDVATSEIMIIISAHCFPVYPDWIEQLSVPFEDENVAIVYGKQRAGETNQYSEHQWFKQYFPDQSQPKQGQPFCHNANSAIRKSIWEKNKFDENITGLEDLAWGSWVQSENYTIHYNADAEIIHLHDETPKQVFHRYQREAIAMKEILPASNFNFISFMKLLIKMIFLDLIQAKRERVFVKEFNSIVWFRIMQYVGTYKGYHHKEEVNAETHRQFYYPPGILSEKVPEKRPVSPIDYQEE
jgi:rhamnosyltransferase